MSDTRIPYLERLREELMKGAATGADDKGSWRRSWRESSPRVVAAIASVVLIFGLGVPLVALYGIHRAHVGPTNRPRFAASGYQVTAQIQLDPGMTDIDVGYGSVWVTGGGNITRISTASNAVVATIPITGTGDDRISVGAGAVWAMSGPDQVVRVDPATNQVVATITLEPTIVDLSAGRERVWATVATQTDSRIYRIDPATNQVSGPPIGLRPGAGAIDFIDPMGVVGAAFWVSNPDEGGSIAEIDPVTGAVLEIAKSSFGSFTYGNGLVWTASQDSVLGIDPTAGVVASQIPDTRAAEAAFSDGVLWVLKSAGSLSADTYEPDPNQPGTVTVIDPISHQPLGDAIDIGATPAHLAVDGAVGWVVNYDSGILYRIE
jgi:virginiamycin B lyase